MAIAYYDMDGNVISLEEWIVLSENFENKRVALTEVDDKRISTVLLGIDHNLSGDGPPLIFETMVFDQDGTDLWCERYATKEEAQEGHDRVVASIIDGTFTEYGEAN